MPTTTNFGWTTPADTDLVKDGALAIRTLGNGIDTSLLDLKGGTTDQVLAKNSNTDMDFKWVTSDDANAIQNAIVDAKGDLIAASANDTPARLAVGSNGTFLTADSGETTGLKWVAAPGEFVLLSTTSLSGATTTISNISQSYTDLYLLIYGVTNATGNGDFRIAPNGTTNASSGQINDGGQNTFTLKVGDYMFITFGTSTNNKPTFTSANNAYAVHIYNYSNTVSYKPYSVSGSFQCINAGGVNAALAAGGYNSTSAITSLVFSNSGGNLSTGTVLLYGVK